MLSWAGLGRTCLTSLPFHSRHVHSLAGPALLHKRQQQPFRTGTNKEPSLRWGPARAESDSDYVSFSLFPSSLHSTGCCYAYPYASIFPILPLLYESLSIWLLQTCGSVCVYACFSLIQHLAWTPCSVCSHSPMGCLHTAPSTCSSMSLLLLERHTHRDCRNWKTAHSQGRWVSKTAVCVVQRGGREREIVRFRLPWASFRLQGPGNLYCPPVSPIHAVRAQGRKSPI